MERRTRDRQRATRSAAVSRGGCHAGPKHRRDPARPRRARAQQGIEGVRRDSAGRRRWQRAAPLFRRIGRRRHALTLAGRRDQPRNPQRTVPPRRRRSRAGRPPDETGTAGHAEPAGLGRTRRCAGTDPGRLRPRAGRADRGHDAAAVRGDHERAGADEQRARREAQSHQRTDARIGERVRVHGRQAVGTVAVSLGSRRSIWPP